MRVDTKITEDDVYKLLRSFKSKKPLSPTISSMVGYFGVSKSLLHKKLNALVESGRVDKVGNNYYTK